MYRGLALIALGVWGGAWLCRALPAPELKAAVFFVACALICVGLRVCARGPHDPNP
jgi:hypothetical protein